MSVDDQPFSGPSCNRWCSHYGDGFGSEEERRTAYEAGRGRYNPWSHAEQLGLRVVYQELSGKMVAGYAHRIRTIYIDPRLTLSQERSALAHEIIHHERGDDGPQSAEVEAGICLEVACRCVDFGRLAQLLKAGWRPTPENRFDRLVAGDALGVSGSTVDLAMTLLTPR